ncbi:MAG: DUF134 domain-containing protein [Candidatus Bathyarchaeales archaeon]
MRRQCCRRRRHRCGRVGRPPKPIIITSTFMTKKLVPTPSGNADPITLDLAEVEALKLIDLEKLSFEEAGAKMGVSRNTVWRLVESAREKIVKAIIENREIQIQK